MVEIFWKEIAPIILRSLKTSKVITKLFGKMTSVQIIDVVVEAIIYRTWRWIFFGNFLCLAFFKTYYCCCVNNYVAIISFNARLKKMYENIDPRHVFDYFNYSLNETITEKFSSITIAKCICYIMTKVVGHNKNFKCRCF